MNFVKEALGQILYGVVGFPLIFVVTVAIVSLSAMLHSPIQSGTYTGQVIDYTHQRGIFFKTNDLTTKTHERSSQREHWCVPDNQPELVKKVRSIDEGTRVDIEYWSPLFVWIDHCGGPNKLIRNITVVNSTGGGR